jgi:hypothetical protein
LCSGPSLRWFQGSSKISHFMKLNELKFWEMVVDIVFHVSPNFQIDPRSWAVYLCKVAMIEVCFEKTSKQIFEVEQIQLGRTWRKEFEDWETQIHYHDLHTKVWYVIMYLIPYEILYEICTYMLYSINFHIILRTYTHMQGPSCSTLTLTLILET